MKRLPDGWECSWTVTEAITILALPLTPRQLRARIQAAGIQPAARRHSGSWRGRPASAYPASALIVLAEVLLLEEAVIEDDLPGLDSTVPVP